MNKYELAVHEARSVLGEHTDLSPLERDTVAAIIVDRLVAKGVVQSTDPDDLRDFRTGPLEPGSKVIGGSK